MSTNEHEEYGIERLSAGNIADLDRLHTAVYGRVPLRNFFSLKYDTHLDLIKYAGFIAYNKERTPIGYYGVIPCLMQFGDKIIPVAQSADTMTHPQHRLKGLFVKLAELTYQLCSEAGIQLIFGFPNQNSLPGFINKLGWQTTERMDCFVIQTGAATWIRAFNKLPLLRTFFRIYQQKQLKNYRTNQQGLENSVLADRYTGIYRDTDYLNYKVYTSNQVIQIGHSLLWIKIGTEIIIGDMMVNPVDFESTMGELKKLARRLGISAIQFHTSPGTTLHRLFLKYNKNEVITSFPVIFKVLDDNIPLDKIKFTFADIDIF